VSVAAAWTATPSHRRRCFYCYFYYYYYYYYYCLPLPLPEEEEAVVGATETGMRHTGPTSLVWVRNMIDERSIDTIINPILSLSLSLYSAMRAV